MNTVTTNHSELTVRKAVIPAAGLGTRVLPASKTVPKEMLTVVDRPAIEYVIEEAVAAGIDDILIITSSAKKALEDHFDRNGELEALLEAKGKHQELASIAAQVDMANFFFTRQNRPLGLGHAVGLARHHIGDEPFAVLLPDEILADGGRLLTDLIETTIRTGGSTVALREVSRDEISRYGCPRLRTDNNLDGNLPDGAVKIDHIVEKPAADEAPSLLAVVGRYVFTSDIFDQIAQTRPGVGAEIQLTDAMDRIARDGHLYGMIGATPSLDTGNRLDYMKTVLELALRRDDLRTDLIPHLRNLLARHGN